MCAYSVHSQCNYWCNENIWLGKFTLEAVGVDELGLTWRKADLSSGALQVNLHILVSLANIWSGVVVFSV